MASVTGAAAAARSLPLRHQRSLHLLHGLARTPPNHAPQILREEVRTLSGQLHRLDERLQFMEQKMGQRRSWLWG